MRTVDLRALERCFEGPIDKVWYVGGKIFTEIEFSRENEGFPVRFRLPSDITSPVVSAFQSSIQRLMDLNVKIYVFRGIDYMLVSNQTR